MIEIWDESCENRTPWWWERHPSTRTREALYDGLRAAIRHYTSVGDTNTVNELRRRLDNLSNG